ncbi:MAG TPA: 3-isopropylmalate dehydratase small subunit [bacterium]|nr:3-isopropylmalate dehydratase small subunit [bacterium]
MSKIDQIEGRGVPVEGNDIDTDRIIPARYLKEITFTNMGKYPFYDERFDAEGKPKGHPFDLPQFAGARLLFVNQNFGCGSSREHAPQSLMRWGVRAIVGESFAEIFAGNCTMLGIPTVTVTQAQAQKLQALVKENPQAHFTLDLAKKTLLADGKEHLKFEIHESKRNALVNGTWDSTGLLLANAGKTAAVAAKLPYVGGF